MTETKTEVTIKLSTGKEVVFTDAEAKELKATLDDLINAPVSPPDPWIRYPAPKDRIYIHCDGESSNRNIY